MGIFKNRQNERIEKAVSEYFKLFTAYSPVFTNFAGGIYEMELTRAAIHSFANQCAKLKPEIKGKAAMNDRLTRMLQFRPNTLMDTKKYLYRLATALKIDNTVFIAPLYDDWDNLTGFYPLIAAKCHLVTSKDNTKYLRYKLDSSSNYAAIELERCGIMTQMQYRDELFGEDNSALKPTMGLLDTQRQGIIEGIKSGAAVRFIAQLNNTLKPDDLEAERKRFRESNLNMSNTGGAIIIDAKYKDVKQLTSGSYSVDSKQTELIRENVFDYFGTNEKILQNKFTSEEWAAFYEGQVEPFALEAGLVHTNMCYTENMLAFGNEIMFTANRLQYLSAKEKAETVKELFDRGLMSRNEGREIFNMPAVEDGNKFYIRKEYALSNADEAEGELNELGN